MIENEHRLWKAHHYLANEGNWSQWEYRREAHVKGLGAVNVVNTIEDSRTLNAWEDFGQGSTAPAGIVFRVVFDDGIERYYQKTGTYDSYGDAEYNGGQFFEVAVTEKTVNVYARLGG
ncbi:hypothetical protein ACFU44_00600 [Nocardia rhizosphaerihabitans]|uniref:hypothetical protein n=1 Tax=Nocardia rhizosphaerihabitans TaxID=1691570 RepID=UPI00366F08D8